MTVRMENSAGRKGIEPARYGTSELATALGMSRIAFGTALAAQYVSTSAKPDGRGHPRRFTPVDAWQFAVFFKLYQHWSRSVVTLGWLVDSLLRQDRIDFRAWPHSATADERPDGLPAQEDVADHIELLAHHRGLLPAWYRHRDVETPFRILVTDKFLEITQSPSIFDKDGVFVNMTRALVDIDDALRRRHRIAPTGVQPQISKSTMGAETF